jgi:hypothetical protein
MFEVEAGLILKDLVDRGLLSFKGRDYQLCDAVQQPLRLEPTTLGVLGSSRRNYTPTAASTGSRDAGAGSVNLLARCPTKNWSV